MRLTEPVETQGVFWLPDCPNDRLQGVLRISTLGAVTLELSGVFGGVISVLNDAGITLDPPAPTIKADHQRIIGVIEGGVAVTLDQCVVINQRVALFGRGHSNSTVLARVAMIGISYENAEEIAFSRVTYTVEGLAEWLSVSGIEPHLNPSDVSGSIDFRVPENISARIPDGVELQFEFAVTGSIPPSPITAVSVEQTVHMSLIVDQPKAISFFSSLCTKICDFLSLALDQPVTINAVNGFPGASSSMASNDAQRVDLYGQFTPWTEAAATIRVNNILFRYGGISNRLDEVLGRWLKAYDSLGPAIHLYFACRTQPTQFIDFKVLWLTQALESWHRRSSDEVDIERAEFKQLMMTLTEACPDDKRNWLRERLQHAYELSLSARLHILIDPFERWFGNIQSRRQFVRRVVDTRNYLTHYSSESKRGAAQGIDLLPLYAKLEALFQLQLLRLVGFSDAVVDEIVRDNQRLTNSLRR